MDIRRDLSYLLAGAVLGALITVIIGAFQEKSPALVVILASVVILCWLTLLSLRIIGPLHLIIVGPAGFRLAGEWKGNFSYQKDGAEVVVRESLEIRQLGRLVRGKSRSTTISGDFPLESTTYTFTASLRPDGILDGTWKNIMPGQRFHGLFQARVRRNGSMISGTWVGVDESGIQMGKFEWSRPT